MEREGSKGNPVMLGSGGRREDSASLPWEVFSQPLLKESFGRVKFQDRISPAKILTLGYAMKYRKRITRKLVVITLLS